MLYLVGTPIGNMGDISSRACEVLSEVDIIACEDTRRTGLLLQSIGVSGHLFSYHEHNKAAKGPVLIEKMKAGQTVALVSDAGMPSISDPGEDLVKLCIENDINVSTVPGPVAAITALVLSGLNTRTYHYEGFLPAENKERKQRLEAITHIDETIIIYEAPHRLMKLISELIDYGFGDSKAAFCRELTKKYEEILRITPNEAKEHFEKTAPKGEFVVCLSPISVPVQNASAEIDIEAEIRKLSEEGKSTKEIAKIMAAATGRNKNEMYETVLGLLK